MGELERLDFSDVLHALRVRAGLEPEPEPLPRWRYFQTGNGPMFSWTTEPRGGRYFSFVHVPVGAGSRSGKASEWTMAEESWSEHELRKDAKARALRLYRAWREEGGRPWR